MSGHSITPRLKPLSARKSATLCVLDVGTSKIVCLIARLDAGRAVATAARAHPSLPILGIGHQRSRGIKAGVVVDMEEAEKAIRLAVDAAERMAGVQVESVIVAIAGGRLGARSSQRQGRDRRPRGHRRRRASRAGGRRRAHAASRAARRCTRCRRAFSLDGAAGIRDPRGMIGDSSASTCMS